MSGSQPRGIPLTQAEKSPTCARTCSEEDEEDRCSYEEQRDKRVAKMREMMLPLVQASQNL